MNASGLQEALHGLCNEAVDVATPEGTAEGRWQPEGERMPELASPAISRPLQDNWRVTSYTGLQQHGPSVALDLTPRFDIDAAGETAEVATPALTPHTFPRGASPGTFLHGLFETLDFSQPPDEAWLAEQLQLAGFGDQWLPMLVDWLSRVLQTPLHQNGVSPAQLMPGQYLVELEFYLPMHQLLTAPALDAVMRRHDPLSARAPELNFQQVQGMLKGFIDLVFCWQGKYYLLDYKSNWLGEEQRLYAAGDGGGDDRSPLRFAVSALYAGAASLFAASCSGLRLRASLRRRVLSVLRGMDGSASENGVFHHRPSIDFVRALDSLFTGDRWNRNEKNERVAARSGRKRLIRPLDLQFAHMLADDEQPALMLAAACVSAEAGEGMSAFRSTIFMTVSCLMADSRSWHRRSGRRRGSRKSGSVCCCRAMRSATARSRRRWSWRSSGFICIACGAAKAAWRALSPPSSPRPPLTTPICSAC